MKRSLALLVVPMLLLSLVTPALGSDYKTIALAYLNEKFGGPDVKIQMYEGGITLLEFTGESFWFAKYDIYKPGKATPSSGGVKPAPTEPAILPAPDTSGKTEPATRPEVMPLPPQDSYHNDYVYGGVYIRLKTGEVLELEAMEAFYMSERVLADQEWERLRQEAGKLEVSLYRRVQGLASGEKVKVAIQPKVVITDDLKAQFSALKSKYPKVFAEWTQTLEELLGVNSGYIVHGRVSAVATDLGPTTATPPDKPVSSTSTPTLTPAARPAEKPAIEPYFDEEYWKQYNAFWAELEQIRVQAVAASLLEVKGALEAIDVEFTDSGYAVATELTANQLKAIAELPSVESIYESYGYEITEDAVLYRGAATGEKAMAPAMTLAGTDAAGSSTPSNRIPIIAGITVLFVGIVVIVQRRLV